MRPMQRKEREDCVNEVRILASSVASPFIVRYFDAFMAGDSHGGRQSLISFMAGDSL